MEHGKTQVPRVVPTGKVYRQMFDAESQLVNALERSSAKGAGLSRHQTENDIAGSRAGRGTASAPQRSAPPQKSATIPLVRDSGTLASDGLLDKRQATWSQGFPNDIHVENPVLYKFYSEALQNEVAESETVRASQEVRGLPDVLTNSKNGSDIIERIAENRRQRHEQTLEEMYQDLGIIASELEPQIAATGTNLMEKLTENDVVIDGLISRIEKDEDVVPYSHAELDELWEEIAQHSISRQSWIKEFDAELSGLEDQRMKRIQDILQNYAQQLEKIAHFMPPDLHKLLDKETQLINQAVLSNRRAYADLYTRLMMTDIEREKRLHINWSKRVEDWKILHTQLVLNRFKEFMESKEVVSPPGVAQVMEEMRTEQKAVNQKRLDLIESLKDFKPPGSTKTAVYKWNQQITAASKEIDQLNQDFFNRLYTEYEKVCQECLRQVDILQEDLMERRVCTEQKAKQVVTESCIPQVGERQSFFEKNLEEMDKALEAHNSHILLSLKSLFKFTQGAAHVWDVHELGLAKQERSLQEKLNEARHFHDTENQDREANLDIIMDRMRQDATEDALKSSLDDAMTLLDQLKQSYDEFHEKQRKIVETYPEMVEKELKNLDGAVCKFFAVDRNSPESDGKNEKGEEEEKVKKVAKKKKRGKAHRAGSRDGIDSSMIPLAVNEVLSTAKGTTFYVLTIAGEYGILPESSEGEEEATAPYLENVDISDSTINDIKKRIRLNFLDHLEDWMDSARGRSDGVVAAKTEELNSELDLRMHLHHPRKRRAELDVHNVRAAELVMHQERVERHCKGINQALTDLKNRFNEMTQEHDRLADKFREDIIALEIVFINATKSSRIIALSNQLQVEQEKFMTVIRTSLRQFRQDLENTLQMIRESNARFMKSFKLFSDGGNFCPEEVEEYRKRLEKMSQKMDSVEGFIMADLEGMESRRLDQASKVSAEFEDRFKHHMVDLVFMEKIARWLTNTQIKIKAEVANSNCQAQNLNQMLIDLDRKTDACLRPNLDKEEVTPSQLNDLVKVMFDAFKERSAYLNSMKDPNAPRPASGKPMQGNPALAMLSEDAEGKKDRPVTPGSDISTSSRGGRIGFADLMPAASRPGKQPSEDPSVPVIKNILKTQKSRIMNAEQSNVEGANGSNPGLQDNSDKKAKVRPPTEQEKKKQNRQGTANNSLPDKSKGQKLDKKYFVFGEKEEAGEDAHLLGRVTKILRDALDGVLAAAEMYYFRQKGNRSVTRPQALQDTFENCADTLVQKLQSYKTQAVEYHNQCLQEFREQLTKLEKLTSEVPQCLVNELLRASQTEMDRQREEMNKTFADRHKYWDKTRVENEQLLRPNLGHPQKAAELIMLCEKEEKRRNEVLKAIEEHGSELEASVAARALLFVENLANLSETMFVDFDELLTVDDVEKGQVPATKYPTNELMRRKKDGKPLVDEEVGETMNRKKTTWQGLPKNEFALEEKAPAPDRSSSRASRNAKQAPVNTTTASVTSAKTTLGHMATEKARDVAYQEFKQYFSSTLQKIRDTKNQQIVDEQRWTDSWNTSVEKVKQLY